MLSSAETVNVKVHTSNGVRLVPTPLLFVFGERIEKDVVHCGMLLVYRGTHAAEYPMKNSEGREICTIKLPKEGYNKEHLRLEGVTLERVE